MSMLSFTDLLRRKENVPDNDEQFDQDGTFEHEIEAALVLDADTASLDDHAFLDESDATGEGTGQVVAVAELPFDSESDDRPQADVLTPHAQAIMAAFNVFEEANASTREELAKIGKAFTSIVTNYNLGRQFLDGSRQEIARASELEQANHRLTIENRRLLERTEKQEGARERQDDLLESAKRRESRLIQDADALRMNLSDLRLEVIELRNANAIAEHARSEMHVALASKSADVERLTREIEVLREKLTAVSTELDSTQKRQTETRLKLDEMQSQHNAEVSKYSELAGRAAAGDKEILRLQKQCDATEALLKEAGLALQNAEHDIWERDRRHQSEIQALKSEIAQLSGRLSVFAGRPRLQSSDVEPETDADQNTDQSVPVIPLRSRPAKARAGRRPDDPTVTAAE